MGKVSLISLTNYVGESFGKEPMEAEQLIASIARVSSGKPKEQRREDFSKLIKYCIKNSHWSIFEMFNVTVSVEVPIFVAVQILRHRSFSFQQFSQRYQSVECVVPTIELRYSGSSNRQSSTEICEDNELNTIAQKSINIAFGTYYELLDAGIAEECARQVLPLCTPTELYMNGTLRSWIHYFEARLDNHTQKEHRELAESVFPLFQEIFPVTFATLNEVRSKQNINLFTLASLGILDNQSLDKDKLTEIP